MGSIVLHARRHAIAKIQSDSQAAVATDAVPPVTLTLECQELADFAANVLLLGAIRFRRLHSLPTQLRKASGSGHPSQMALEASQKSRTI